MYTFTSINNSGYRWVRSAEEPNSIHPNMRFSYHAETPGTSFTFPSSRISSGVDAIDKMHQEIFTALTSLSSASDEEFGERYAGFVRQLETIFRQEEDWMEEMPFPILNSHREQHARVLGALCHAHTQVMRGDFTVARRIVTSLLPEWLSFHMSTMDMVLAVAMQVSQVPP